MNFIGLFQRRIQRSRLFGVHKDFYMRPNSALLVDHSKFGQRALARVLGTDEIHCIVTDADTPEEELLQLAAAGIEVRRAERTEEVKHVA